MRRVQLWSLARATFASSVRPSWPSAARKPGVSPGHFGERPRPMSRAWTASCPPKKLIPALSRSLLDGRRYSKRLPFDPTLGRQDMARPFAFDPFREQLRQTNREAHGNDPSCEDHQPRYCDLRPRRLPQHVGAVDHPVPGGMGNDRRHHDDPHPPRHRAPEQQSERRNEDAQNGELANLDPDVEREQRHQQIRAGELELLLEDVGEAETVHEPEQPGDDPAPPQAGADDVLESHIDDRHGDGRFDERGKPRPDGSDVIRGPGHRYRVADSESRDHWDETPNPAKRND